MSEGKGKAAEASDAEDFVDDSPGISAEAFFADTKMQKAALEAADKKTKFRQVSDDFWQFNTSDQKELSGVYLSWGRAGRLVQHGIGMVDAKGVKRVVKFNGSHKVTAALKNVPVGTPVRIEYLGQSKTSNGRKLNDFKVYLPEQG